MGSWRSKYEKIISDNLAVALSKYPEGLRDRIGAIREADAYLFRAFGKDCVIKHDEILLDGQPEWGPLGVIISLYALNASTDPIVLEPYKSFKEFPNSMPYQGAFRSNAEAPLVAYVERIRQKRDTIIRSLGGHNAPEQLKGDLSFVVYPLPKIALAYIFYLPDEEFPASATCLFCSNALSFMPLDGLADVAEYTSKAIIEIVTDTPDC